MTEALVRAADVAAALDVKAGTVLDWFENGKLPGFRLGGKGGPVRFRWSEVEAWLEAGRTGATVSAPLTPGVE